MHVETIWQAYEPEAPMPRSARHGQRPCSLCGETGGPNLTLNGKAICAPCVELVVTEAA